MAGIHREIERLEALTALIEETAPDDPAVWTSLIARRQHLIDAVGRAAGPGLDGVTQARLAAIERRGRRHAEKLERVRALLHQQLGGLYRDNVLVRAYLAR